MNKWLIALLIINVSLAVEATTINVDSSMPIEPRMNACNVSPTFISQIKNALIEDLNVSPSAFTNVSRIYCYEYDSGKSFSIELTIKDSADSIESEVISASFYISKQFDYNAIFTPEELNVIGYTLRERYAKYLLNGTNKEYYVSMSGDCSDLRIVYDSLSGEKYFNENGDYCQIILKTRTSNIKNLIRNKISYLNYFSEEVKYRFDGFSAGDFNLESLSNSMNCDLSKSNYYYPEFESECYGIYKDKGRIYFSASMDGGYLSVAGIIGGKAKVTINNWNNELSDAEINDWANKLINEYFNGLSVEEKIYDSFTINYDALNELNKSESAMNTYYQGEGVWATLTAPYIQVYVTIDESEDNYGMILPYYRSNYFVVTKEGVYSAFTLGLNDENQAKQQLKSYVEPFVSTDEWVVNMTVTGNYYHYPLGVKEEVALVSGGMDSSTQNFRGINDALLTNNPEAIDDFEALESKGFWESINDWLTNLFK